MFNNRPKKPDEVVERKQDFVVRMPKLFDVDEEVEKYMNRCVWPRVKDLQEQIKHIEELLKKKQELAASSSTNNSDKPSISPRK